MPLPIFTVGHSTRSLEEFLALLTEHGIELLADVRRFPGSRRFPHFRRETLSAALETAGITYRHLPVLGGHRKPNPDSPHTYWTNAGFRAYADHMGTPEFQDGFAELVRLAEEQTAALMCAEAVPWRCHRQLVADALVAGGRRVIHILAPGRTEEHALKPSVLVRPDGRLIYDGGAGQQGKLFD